MVMKAELKEKWVAALRSRKFKQGQGALKELVDAEKNKISYCCLGVLHEVGGGKWHLYDKSDDIFRTGARSSGSTGDCYLNGSYAKGLDEDTQKQLAAMNDGGKKFYEIANWIEKNIPTK